MCNGEIYKEICEKLEKEEKEKKLFLYLIKDEANKQLSYYRQRKEDLIARMATDWPQWGCGLDFFTFFIQPLFRNPLLLHFINLSDDIGLSQITIKYGYVENNIISWAEHSIEILKIKNSNKQTCQIQNPNLVDYAIALMKEIEVDNTKFYITEKVKNLKSSLVRIRDADIGVQAFFSFFEGLIRNAAKHRIRSGQKDQLEVRIVLCEDVERVKNLFKSTGGNNEMPQLPEEKKYGYLIIGVNTDVLKENGEDRTIREGSENKKIIEFIRKHLNSEIIDATGQITPGNWGLKEMKICAAFLSGANVEEVNSTNPDYIWITKAPQRMWCDKIERFAYILRLEKPRYVLAIVNKIPNGVNLNEWEQQGIKIIKPDEIKNVNLDYDFLYLDKNITIPENINPVLLPQRKVQNNIKINSVKNPIDLLYQVYNLHLQTLIGENKYKVIIYFEDENKANTWNNWWASLKEKPANVEFVFPKDSREAMNEGDKNNNYWKIGILRHTGIASLNFLRSNNTSKIYYQEYASYSNLFFSFLYNIDPNNLGNLIIRQLLESTIMNVLVIDERIAQVLTTAEADDAGGKVKLEKKLYWMGIYVAKSVIANGKTFNYIEDGKSEWMVNINFNDIINSNKTNENQESKIKVSFNNGSSNCEEVPIHILLIHATRLNEIAEIYEKSNNQLIENLKKVIPYVIVHSGRGKTKGDIPSNAPFVEYSVIQKYLLQEPSKFFLVQIALSAKGGD